MMFIHRWALVLALVATGCGRFGFELQQSAYQSADGGDAPADAAFIVDAQFAIDAGTTRDSGATNDGGDAAPPPACDTNCQALVAPPVLDNFNRGDGPVGGSWNSNDLVYAIRNRSLGLLMGGQLAMTWPTQYGVNQRVDFTVTKIYGTWFDLSVTLKEQSLPKGGTSLLRVYICETGAAWTYEGGPISNQLSFTLGEGDRVGVAALSDGRLLIYRNGTLVASDTVRAWRDYAQGGIVGFRSGTDASNVDIDDFAARSF